VLSKLTAINLILAFAMACKHKLRHEIEYDYTDLKPLIENLDTFARSAAPADRTPSSHNNALFAPVKSWGEKLGISFLESNPRKAYKKAANQKRHHGNLPYEIIGYLGRWIRDGMDNGTFDSTVMQGQVYGAFNQLMDAYTSCDKVLQTPLPLAYNIAISQITWLYVMVLPFQLVKTLKYITIPGTVVAGMLTFPYRSVRLDTLMLCVFVGR
jgi:putative membrane protein